MLLYFYFACHCLKVTNLSFSLSFDMFSYFYFDVIFYQFPKHCHHFLFRLLSTYFNWICLTLKSVKHLLKVFYVTKKFVVAYIYKSPKPSLFNKHLFAKCIYFIYQHICSFLLIFKKFWFPICVRVKPVFGIVCQQNVHAQDFLREPSIASGC